MFYRVQIYLSESILAHFFYQCLYNYYTSMCRKLNKKKRWPLFYIADSRWRIRSSSLRSRDSDASDSGSGWGGGLVNSGGGSTFLTSRLGDCNGDNSGVTGGDATLTGEAMGVALGVGCGVSIWSGLYRYSCRIKKNMHHFLISLKKIFLVIYNNNSFSSFPLFHILIQLNIVIAKQQGWAILIYH